MSPPPLLRGCCNIFCPVIFSWKQHVASRTSCWLHTSRPHAERFSVVLMRPEAVTSTQQQRRGCSSQSCVRICLWTALCMLRAALMAPPTHRWITSTFVSARWERPLRQLWSILSYEREAAVLLSVEVFKLLAFCKDSVSSFFSCGVFGCFSLHCSLPQKKQNSDNIQILNQHSCFCLLIVFEPGICAQLLTKIQLNRSNNSRASNSRCNHIQTTHNNVFISQNMHHKLHLINSLFNYYIF